MIVIKNIHLLSWKRRKKKIKTLFNIFKETFIKGFLIVADFAHNSKSKIMRVGKILRSTLHTIITIFYSESSNIIIISLTPVPTVLRIASR